MPVTEGDDITLSPEPLPQGSVLDSMGRFARSWMNYLQGKDRREGEIISGVNRNRKNIVLLQTEYQAADGAISSAYIAADAVVAADAAGARATLSTTLTAAYQAADATLQTDINTRATITYVDSAIADEASARASAISAVEAAYEAADTTISASVTTNATAIASLEGAAAIYEIIAAASGSDPARVKLKAGVDGADVELDANRVWFGYQTRFDTTSETFITEVGGVRSRYGTAFGASGNEVVMWHGPTSVAVGSEARNNGYLVIGTDGSIWYNTGELDWGATAAEAAASNAVVPVGVNMVVDSDFERGTTFWAPYWGGNTGTAISSGINEVNWYGPRNVLRANAAGTPANGLQFEVGASAGEGSARMYRAMRVNAGDRVYARALAAYHRASYAAINVHWYNSSGTLISETVVATGGTVGGAYLGLRENFSLLEGYATAPANAYYCDLRLRVYCNGTESNPTGYFTEPMLMRVPAGQTATGISYQSSRPDPLADPTSSNTAAGIAGQGSQATANHQRGASYSGTPTEGSWWVDTGTNELKIYTGGAWQVVANVGGAALTISRSGGFVGSRSGSGNITTSTATFSVTGGVGPYTWEHELFTMFTDGPTASLTSGSGTTTQVSADSVSGGVSLRGFVKTIVTDAAGNKGYRESQVLLTWL